MASSYLEHHDSVAATEVAVAPRHGALWWGRWLAAWCRHIPRSVPEADRRVYNIRLVLLIIPAGIHVSLALVFAGFTTWDLMAVNIGAVAWYVLTIAILRTGRHRAAMFLGLVEALLHGTLFTLLLGIQAGYVFYNFGILTVALLAYRACERRARLTLIALCVILSAVAIVGMRDRAPLIDLGSWEIEVLFYLNVIGSLLGGTGAIFYFARATDRAEARLAKALDCSDTLLLNILPTVIAERLKRHPGTIADNFPMVTVMFADIVGFTPLASKLPGAKLVELLNDVFSMFDHSAERHKVEKIKTIGDAYMVVGGLPAPQDDHAAAVCAMALEMEKAVKEYSARSGVPISLRIGIHTGPVVAGVIGKKKFAYDIWGDTVNTASRLESHGVPGSIQVSEATFRLLPGRFQFEERGVIELKGKGEMRTWFLRGPAQEPGS